MAPRTVQQRFGWKPEELTAATIGAGLEGYRGPGSVDPVAVAAVLKQRQLSGKWGGRDIRNILTAPGQFAAILDRGITMQQLSDPAFGAKVLGGQAEFNRIQSMINNPALMAEQMGKVGESFRALSEGPKPGDYIPVPGKSNFYFNRNPAIAKQGLQLLDGASAGAPQPTAPPGVLSTLAQTLGFDPTQQPEPKTIAQQLLDQTKNQLIQQMLPKVFGSITLSPPPVIGGM